MTAQIKKVSLKTVTVKIVNTINVTVGMTNHCFTESLVASSTTIGHTNSRKKFHIFTSPFKKTTFGHTSAMSKSLKETL